MPTDMLVHPLLFIRDSRLALSALGQVAAADSSGGLGVVDGSDGGGSEGKRSARRGSSVQRCYAYAVVPAPAAPL